MFRTSNLSHCNIANLCTRKYSVNRVNFSQTHYEVLGLPESCTNAEIKDAFFEKMKLLHPDRNAQNSKNHQLAIDLNEAYAVLGKKHSRENYDHYLSMSRSRFSRNNTVSNNPYDRVNFRDRDHFYQHTRGRNRYYEESFNRDGWFYEHSSQHGKFYEEKPYYGIKGVKRFPNIYIAAGCVIFMIVGSMFQYFITTISTRYCLKQLNERDQQAKQAYESVRRNSLNYDKKQLELLKMRHVSQDPIKFHEEINQRREEVLKCESKDSAIH